ncbi:hypothetical protein [Actinospica robiniae]|uniref:hypothetical protein n=1 Tax=Actinospica robiniae TaxID=304901 RepID=UPI000556570A|nr:hypothetical protein [Actinospica robiniae]
MFARGAECPVGAGDRQWIEDAFSWLAGRPEVAPPADTVFLPTAEHFPGPFSGDLEQVRALVAGTATRMGLGELTDLRVVPFKRGHSGCPGYPGGAFGGEKERPSVAIDPELVRRPVELIATIVHMLAHLRLADVPARDDARERWFAVYAVYAGFGVFGANAAVEIQQDPGANPRAAVSLGLRQARPSHYYSGYLTEEAHGYALACFAFLRGESAPKWAKHLDTNPRVYMRRSLRYLASHASEQLRALLPVPS